MHLAVPVESHAPALEGAAKPACKLNAHPDDHVPTELVSGPLLYYIYIFRAQNWVVLKIIHHRSAPLFERFVGVKDCSYYIHVCILFSILNTACLYDSKIAWFL